MKSLILGIDASNIRGGGGVTHLVELLGHADPEAHGFLKVIVWGGLNTLNQIQDRDWLEKREEPWLNKNLVFRTFWQKVILPRRIRSEAISVVFFPGAIIRIGQGPFVSMSQNLLPYEHEEIARYPFGLARLRLHLLKRQQRRAFRASRGIIFLSEFARSKVLESVELQGQQFAVIPHGINKRFYLKPDETRELERCNSGNPFRILYVSFIGEYKHQWILIEAVQNLRNQGWPVQLTLVGGEVDPGAVQKTRKALDRDPESAAYIEQKTSISYNDVLEEYRNSDLVVFLSSCETFGQILTEAMAAGRAILCSRMSSLPEVGGNAVSYTDPLSVEAVQSNLERLIRNGRERSSLSQMASARAREFSWERTARETFSFLAENARG